MNDQILDNIVGLAARLLQYHCDEEAKSLLEGVLSVSNHRDAWFGLGLLALRVEDPESAAQYIEQALQLAPKSAQIRMLLAEALIKGNNPLDAAPHLAKLRDTEYAARAQALSRANRRGQ